MDSLEDNSIIKNIEYKKEFLLTKIDDDKKYKEFIVTNGFKIQTKQRLLEMIINVDSPIKRFYVKWDTGMGKTIGAIQICDNYYSKVSKTIQDLKIYIIGFTRNIFIEDFFRYSEFGYITDEEIEVLNKLRRKLIKGSKDDIENYKNYFNDLKKRIIGKKGHFVFMGYQEFFTRIFTNITDKNKDLLDNLEYNIENNLINVDYNLIESMQNSLVVCDEIHNTYNSEKQNNWGKALQYVSDYNKDYQMRMIFLSATPLNSKPSEIIDMINYTNPGLKLRREDYFGNNGRLIDNSKLDYLINFLKYRVSFVQDTDMTNYPRSNMIGETRVLPTDIEGIREIPYLKFIPCPMPEFMYRTYINKEGKIQSDEQTLIDMVFPAVKGTTFKDIKEGKGTGLYKTKEIQSRIATMTEQEHINLGIYIDKHSDNRRLVGDYLLKENIKYYSAKDPVLLDLIFDILQNKPGQKIMIIHPRVKLSGTNKIEDLLRLNGIPDYTDKPMYNTPCSICGKDYKGHLKSGGGNYIEEKFESVLEDNNIRYVDYITKDSNGDIIKFTREIYIYNQKIFTSTCEKINDTFTCTGFNNLTGLYNNEISGGAKTPKKVVKSNLKKNNINTNKIKKESKKKIYSKEIKASEHTYSPVRLCSLNSELDDFVKQKVLLSFNSPYNNYGKDFTIIICSKIIKESYDIKDVRHQVIYKQFNTTNDLKQVMGRCNRRKSHANLLPEERTITYYFLLTTVDKSMVKKYIDDPQPIDYITEDEERYAKIMKNYLEIQEIEKKIHEIAIDAPLNYTKDLFKSDNVLKILQYYPKNLPDKTITKPDDPNLDLSTYYSLGYFNLEIEEIIIIIKKLLKKKYCLNYKQLIELIRNPPFRSTFDEKLYDEGNIQLALKFLIEDTLFLGKVTNIQNPNQNIIIKNGIFHKIAQIEDWFILVPYDNNPIIDINSYFYNYGLYQYDLNLVDYNSSDISFEAEYMKTYNKYNKYINSDELILFIGMPSKFHFSLLEQIIYKFNDNEYSKSIDYDTKFLNKLIEIYTNFKILVKKNKIPYGYYCKDNFKYYSNKMWQETIHPFIIMQENKRNVIGMYDNGVFKIRKTFTKSDMLMEDKRNITSGERCTTKQKEIIKEYADLLGIKKTDNKKKRSLCYEIELELVTREYNVRLNNKKERYVYLFNEYIPNIREYSTQFK